MLPTISRRIADHPAPGAPRPPTHETQPAAHPDLPATSRPSEEPIIVIYPANLAVWIAGARHPRG